MNKLISLSLEQQTMILNILNQFGVDDVEIEGLVDRRNEELFQSCKDALQKDVRGEIKTNLIDQTITLDQLIKTFSKTEIIAIKAKWILPYLVELNKIIREEI